MLCNLFVPGGFFQGQATLGTTLTLLSAQLYALLGLFMLGYIGWYRGRLAEDGETDGPPVSQPV